MNQTKETNESKKEFLRSYKAIYLKVKSLEEQKQSIQELKRSAKAIVYDDMPKGHKDTDLSDYIVKLEDLDNKISSTIVEKNKLKAKIEEMISRMDDGTECMVLRKRYIEFKKWRDITAELNLAGLDCSERQVTRIHGYALRHFPLDDYNCLSLSE